MSHYCVDESAVPFLGCWAMSHAPEMISQRRMAKYGLAVMLVGELADVLQSLSASSDCSDTQSVDVTTDLAEMLESFFDLCPKALGANHCLHLDLL